MKKKKLKDLIKRLKKENHDLSCKIGYIDAMLLKCDNDEMKISDFQYAMLTNQEKAMIEYSEILLQRIEDFEVQLEKKKEK